jgi:septal ring factor EnvC (AmiA/AmiB activator)
MGHGTIAVALSAALGLLSSAQAGVQKKEYIESIKGEIGTLEQDLLQNAESQRSVNVQLKKIRRLLTLQQKEIEFSRAKIDELAVSMKGLSEQKTKLMESVENRKKSLRTRLRELTKLGESVPLEADWLADLEVSNQKEYYLTKTLKRDLAEVTRLKQDVQEALALELRILEEKNRLDFYVHDLQNQLAQLNANEELHREILRTNHASRLDALRRIRSLKESEHEIEKMIQGMGHHDRDSSGFLALKGRLPLPATGSVLGGFGKSYDRKTSLLTFQKGITLAVSDGADVRTVAPGRVAFAGPLKNYGLIAIVEHEGRYYTLYGQMAKLTAHEGAEVKQGDVLGQTSAEPLYFEIRDKNVAINPLQWLLNGSITLSKH